MRKVGFRLVQRIVFEIDCKNLILLVFWCRIANYFLVDFVLLSFGNSLTCVWFHHFLLLISFVFSVIPLWETAEKFSLLLLESYQLFGGVFSKIFLNTSHYIWTFLSHFVGVFFVSSWKYPLLILEYFHLFVRVFSWTFSKNSPTIIGHLPYPLTGCFKKFAVIYYSSTTIGHFRYET